MKTKIKKIIAIILATGIFACVSFASSCYVKGQGDNTQNDQNNSQDNNPSDDVDDGDQGEDSGNEDNDGEEDIPKVEKSIYLDEIGYTYASTGYGSISVNKGSDGNKLSLYKDEAETEHEHGFFAHAYSVISYDDIASMGFTRFSAYIGINKTARVANTRTSVIFRVFVDNTEVYTSTQFGAYTDEQYITVDIEDAERLTLVADSVDGNGNDHAVWADCTLTYYNDVKPNLQTYDVEFSSPYQVTEANILENARATSVSGEDLSDAITYTTDYKAGQTGEFEITYKVCDGSVAATKTVNMKVLSDKRYVTEADEEYLIQPFADFVYYGRSLLSSQSRLAYDLLMSELLKTDISDKASTSLTVKLLDNGIYIFPDEVSKIKKFLVYDEARLYFIYDWRTGESAGVSYTKKGPFVDTVTVKLNNGSGEYYNNQSNISVYKKAEEGVISFFSGLTTDMTEAQMLYKVQNAYRSTITYANVNYADGFYGAFITKQCICSGYSKGYDYLAQRLGVRSAYVVGPSHAWNYIHADGAWYMTDTTWGDGNSYGLLGKSDMDNMGRYDYANYGKMPALSYLRYDTALMKYPLMEVRSGYMIAAGETLDLKDLVTVTGAVADKAPVVSVKYTGALDTEKAGTYKISVTAVNSLGNIVTGDCEVYVYGTTQKLTSFSAIQSGNSNYAYRSVSLYYGGNERAFEDGIYTKANGTLSLDFNIAGSGYTRFSANVGVDKVIRDNKPWGEYANATVRVYADGNLLYELKGIGWKKDYTYFVVELPEGTQTLRLEVTDTSGQGGIGWGDCTLYR